MRPARAHPPHDEQATEQLPLIEAQPDWRLDAATRELGRRGVAEARRALAAARGALVAHRPTDRAA